MKIFYINMQISYQKVISHPYVYSDVINKRVQISHTQTYSSNTTDRCHGLNRNWVPFRYNCGHPRLLVGFDLWFSVWRYVDHCLSFWPLSFSVFLRFTDSEYHFGIFKLFLSEIGIHKDFDLSTTVDFLMHVFLAKL